MQKVENGQNAKIVEKAKMLKCKNCENANMWKRATDKNLKTVKRINLRRVKMQKCENGQNAKMWHWSKGKNVKTV